MKTTTKTTTLRLLAAASGILLVVAAILATPAVLSSFAAVAGLLVAASVAQIPTMDRPAPVAIVRVIEVQTTQVLELDDGVGIVVFRRVDGKLTSRMYRTKLAA